MESVIRLHSNAMVCVNSEEFAEFISLTDKFELGIGIAIEGREVIFNIGQDHYDVLLDHIKQGFADES